MGVDPETHAVDDALVHATAGTMQKTARCDTVD
jgi:hypothetical protein